MDGRATDPGWRLQKSLIAVDLSAGRKRELATMLAEGGDYPVKRVCEVLGLPRNTYYHEGRGESMGKS